MSEREPTSWRCTCCEREQHMNVAPLFHIGSGPYPQKRTVTDTYLRCNCGWQSARLDYSMGWWSEPEHRQAERTRWKPKDTT